MDAEVPSEPLTLEETAPVEEVSEPEIEEPAPEPIIDEAPTEVANTEDSTEEITPEVVSEVEAAAEVVSPESEEVPPAEPSVEVAETVAESVEEASDSATESPEEVSAETEAPVAVEKVQVEEPPAPKKKPRKIVMAPGFGGSANQQVTPVAPVARPLDPKAPTPRKSKGRPLIMMSCNRYIEDEQC